MGTGWRRAFCSTREAAPDSSSTPRLRCKTINEKDLLTPKSSYPSSPRSPFSILRNTLRLSRYSCGLCAQSLKRGAIYTAECSHAFHFPCIVSHVRNQASLVCPLCSAAWRDVPLLAVHAQQSPISTPKFNKSCDLLASYADDEPLVTPTAGGKFPPICNDDEEIEEFQGFFVNPISSCDALNAWDPTAVDVRLSPEAAVVSQGSYAVVLKVKAPPPPHAAHRAPIDLVTVLDVSGSMTGPKLEMLKRAMRLVIGSLAPADRLSILAFSAAPKRLLPLRRMTAQGQRSARRIIDRLSCSHGSSLAEALKEATRVLEERRERNPVASLILLSDGQDGAPAHNGAANQRRGSPHSTRFAHVEIPVHSHGAPAESAFSRCVAGLLSVVVQDLKIRIGFAPGSDPAEITAIYSCNERPTILGSTCIRLGDLYAEEEKEMLVEIRVPVSRVGSHHVISTQCFYRDPATQEVIYGKEQALLVPRPQIAPASPEIERLRNVFITSRAVAESRRLIEHDRLSSAVQLLSSARELLLQSRSETAGECVRGLEAELGEVQWRRSYQQRMLLRRSNEERERGVFVEEAVTPTSAARRNKSLERVGDLHGFENARF